MGLFDGKKGLIFGVANEFSIAWAIAKQLHAQGAQIGFTHLPDRNPENPRLTKKMRNMLEKEGMQEHLILPCDVQNDEHLNTVFAAAKETFGTIDFLVHAIAFAPADDLKAPTYKCSRKGFLLSMDISVYSLIDLTNRARSLMTSGGSVLTLTYFGGERVVPGYNLMGICKSALDSSTRYLASELGTAGIRVNALSAGPVKTAAAVGIGEFDKMEKLYETFSPPKRNVTREEVAQSAMFLLSDLASGITGEVMHVDCGYNIMGGPPSDFVSFTAQG